MLVCKMMLDVYLEPRSQVSVEILKEIYEVVWQTLKRHLPLELRNRTN